MDIKEAILTHGVSINLLKLPILGPWLCRLLGGGIGPHEDNSKKHKAILLANSGNAVHLENHKEEN